MSDCPTQAQLNAIIDIEHWTGKKFVGKTKKDAWRFINDNLAEAKKIAHDHFFDINMKRQFKRDYLDE